MSWGSWLTGAPADAASKPNFAPITSLPQNELFGPLLPGDLEWTCAGGFTTETQTWYTILADGAFATSQIIHSSVGLWYPQIQFTFKYFNPKTGQKIWKSVAVTHFVTPPPAGSGRDKTKAYDKRSSKSDQFSVLFDTLPDGSESYEISASFDQEVQIAYTYTRPASAKGWKLGAGPNGGKSVFGASQDSPDGYVLHRFWPHAKTSGHLILKGQLVDAAGSGLFVHAIQGMRPNLVAATWNFANFQSDALGGVAALLMEFTTTPQYGEPKPEAEQQAAAQSGAGRVAAALTGPEREKVSVTIGSITVGGQLVAVAGSTAVKGATLPTTSTTSVQHLNPVQDPETGYLAPQQIKYVWDAPALDPASGKGKSATQIKAELTTDLGVPYPSTSTKGLIEKVDLLGEMPAVVKKLVNYAAGTKPFIYQTLNPVTLSLTLPEGAAAGEAGTHSVEGTLFEEHTFISA
ncbi:putative cell survival pathways protein [Tilletia horrida]|uniref:Cell survival pathways protein n=1 Tax=Tilletia horrida TaxID=155126 RepID=A0AAN6GER8_9BASI|nr:putative cell survival pathways protein [Tilletia horrida]KAK0535400.1 putative cell survival pathways protein [Tilletia horrida]KAK0536760.1 putative cell survival pathways protein [Tilletia horrida]KAK0560515.1 putative cell survival pathways protein [Tilletia horrida]